MPSRVLVIDFLLRQARFQNPARFPHSRYPPGPRGLGRFEKTLQFPKLDRGLGSQLRSQPMYRFALRYPNLGLSGVRKLKFDLPWR